LFRLLFIAFLLYAPAHADDLAKYDGKFRLAKEMELKVSRLQYLMRYFRLDWSAIYSFPNSVLDEYLDEPSNLDFLKEDLRKSLTHGLENDLAAPQIDVEDSKPVLLGPDGQPFGDGKIIVANKSDSSVKQKEPSPASKQLVSPAGTPIKASGRNAAWKTVRERWAKLPSEVKMAHANPNRFSAVVRAAVALTNSRLLLPGPQTEDLNFHYTNGGLEFKDSDKTNSYSPREFLDGLADFGRKSGITNYLEDPLGHHDGEASYHIHISTLEPRNLHAIVSAMNELYLLRFVAAGEGASILSPGGFGYSADIKDKGIVRLLKSNHFEIRTHVTSAETELREVLGWLSSSEEEALKSIYGETERLLSRANIDTLLQYPEGAPVLERTRRRVSQAKQQEIEEALRHSVQKLADGLPDLPFYQFVQVVSALQSQGMWPEIQAHLAKKNLLPMFADWSIDFGTVVRELEKLDAFHEPSPFMEQLMNPAVIRHFGNRLKNKESDVLHSAISAVNTSHAGSKKFVTAVMKHWAEHHFHPPTNAKEARSFWLVLQYFWDLGLHGLNGHITNPNAVAEVKKVPRVVEDWRLIARLHRVAGGKTLSAEVTREFAPSLNQALLFDFLRRLSPSDEPWVEIAKQARPDLNWHGFRRACDIFGTLGGEGS